jgi:predicted nucleic acid-binding protein
MILVDAGPLVALIHADDRHHERCTAAFHSLHEPLGTVWPPFTEAMYLLNFSWKAQEALWQILDRRVLILPLDQNDFPRIQDLMRKYKDLPMDLADAALVRVRNVKVFRGFLPLTGGISRYTDRKRLVGSAYCRIDDGYRADSR